MINHFPARRLFCACIHARISRPLADSPLAHSTFRENSVGISSSASLEGLADLHAVPRSEAIASDRLKCLTVVARNIKAL